MLIDFVMLCYHIIMPVSILFSRIVKINIDTVMYMCYDTLAEEVME